MAGRRDAVRAVLAACALVIGLVAGPGAAGAAGPLAGIVSISTGVAHACAVLTDTQVVCWGANNQGQLGNGTLEFSAVPMPVVTALGGPPLTGAVSVSVSREHSCAVLADGEARCWGWNADSLGDGTTDQSLVPVTVVSAAGGPPLTGIASIDTGGFGSCARLTSGQAKCWGLRYLGDGSTGLGSVPVTVAADATGQPLTGITSLTVGNGYACARLASSEARCWGANDFGQLGDGTTTDRPLPVPVVSTPGGPALSGIAEVAAGFVHTCARLTSGQARCWGYNALGELGDGTTTERTVPVAVVVNRGGRPLTGIAGIQVGGYNSCAVLTSGEARCWGLNTSGQLGDGTTVQQSTQPVTVVSGSGPRKQALSGIVALSGGQEFMCARLLSGQARCWGLNTSFQLGTGTDISQSAVPLTVMG